MFDRTTGPTEESPLTELTELSAAGAPRRFVRCAVDGVRDDGARDDVKRCSLR